MNEETRVRAGIGALTGCLGMLVGIWVGTWLATAHDARKDHADCILEHLKPEMTVNAASMVRWACDEKYPTP